MIVVIGVVIIIVIVIMIMNKNIEKADFLRDDLYIPELPELNSVPSGTSRLIRIIGITPHLKMDKFNLVQSIWFKPPTPNQGEKKCTRVKCKPWFQKVGCWKCD